MSEPVRLNLNSAYLRLRPDATIEPLPLGPDFWPQLMSGKLGDFHNEYLVTLSEYEQDWPSWERHPAGDEIVCLLAGAVTLVLELEGGNREVQLSTAGDYVCIPRNTWHTAKTSTPSSMLFITAGEGTEIRPTVT